jgi:hypothetical protein
MPRLVPHLLALWLLPASVLGQESTPPGDTIEIVLSEGALRRGDVVVELGCEGGPLVLDGTRAFVGCGADGVAAVDFAASPPSLLRLPTGGVVTGLFVVEGQLWARHADATARAIASVGPAPAVRAAPSGGAELSPPLAVPPPPARDDTSPAPDAPMDDPPGTTRRQVGELREVRGGTAVVAFERPIARGTLVELHPPEGAERPIAYGRVAEIDRRAGVVEVAVEANVRITEDMVPESTGQLGGTTLAPALPFDTLELGAILRPFLPVGPIGVGLTGGLWVSWLPRLGDSDLALRLTAELTELGALANREGLPVAALGHAMVGLAWRYLEFGVGAGTTTNQTQGFFGCSDGQGPRLSVAQHLRIGSPDGLMVRSRLSAFVRQECGASSWDFGNLHVDFQVPIGHGVWLVVEAGGGNSGSIQSALSARLRLTGNGLTDSLFLTVGAGFGMVLSAGVDRAGPAVSAGIAYRL